MRLFSRVQPIPDARSHHSFWRLCMARPPCAGWGNGEAARGAADERCAVRLPGACARSDAVRLPVRGERTPAGERGGVRCAFAVRMTTGRQAHR